jgi:hypothetical protein
VVSVTGIPFVQKHVKGPKWLQLLVGVSLDFTLLFSSCDAYLYLSCLIAAFDSCLLFDENIVLVVYLFMLHWRNSNSEPCLGTVLLGDVGQPIIHS